MSGIRSLPVGVYAVSAQFTAGSGVSEFVFRGETFRAEAGVSGFARFEEAFEKADRTPEEPFQGGSYTTPVLLVPEGTYEFGKVLMTPVPRAVAILGEQAGVSPNGSDGTLDARWAAHASRTHGLFYWGAFVVADGVEGTFTLDGLALDATRIYDRRTSGTGLGLVIRNCTFEGALTQTLVSASPLREGSDRTVLLKDCRLDGFDSLDDEGGMLFASATKLTVDGLYFAHTRKIFGLTNYSRTFRNTSSVPSEIMIRNSVFEDAESVHGLSVFLPEDAKASVTIENTAVRHMTPDGDPAITVNLPNPCCSLTIRNCSFEGKADKPAVLTDGCKDAAVTVEGCEQTGYCELTAWKPARRTEAPDTVGISVWDDSRLDDPHEASDNGDFNMLEALYSGRRAYHGDIHTHSNSGGTSDGATPLAEFVEQLRALKLDFAAVVDHQQMRHMFLPEWDPSMLIYGTEPGTVIVEEGRAPRSTQLHYVMFFQHPNDLGRVLKAFPEFEYSGGLEGSFKYPKFTPERLAELARFVRGLGGMFSHAHPKQLMASDNPLDFYFTDAVALETIYGDADGYGTVQNLRLWDALLRMGKRVHTMGDSDTHGIASNRALTTVYSWERNGSAFLREVREGDCAAGPIGVKMAIAGQRMGGSLPYRDGMTLTVELDDVYEPTYKKDTVYCLRVLTDKGLAYASEFSGKLPQKLALPVKDRKYYRVEVTNESDGFIVAISNPIWLDK